MSTTNLEQELAAITSITNALEQLDEDGRKRVIRYVFDHLQLPITNQEAKGSQDNDRTDEDNTTDEKKLRANIHDIRALRDEKRPTTDVQMIALVAYYLAELAPEALRKESISAADVSEYFKQASHPLPPEAKYTLQNARNAGYLDSLGSGQYRLNPVGHNLVVHKLPRETSEGDSTGRRRKRKVTSRKKTRTAKGKAKKSSSS